jgi:hypothetical protein
LAQDKEYGARVREFANTIIFSDRQYRTLLECSKAICAILNSTRVNRELSDNFFSQLNTLQRIASTENISGSSYLLNRGMYLKAIAAYLQTLLENYKFIFQPVVTELLSKHCHLRRERNVYFDTLGLCPKRIDETKTGIYTLSQLVTTFPAPLKDRLCRLYELSTTSLQEPLTYNNSDPILIPANTAAQLMSLVTNSAISSSRT